MEPIVGVERPVVESADGTLTIGREAFQQFCSFARLGVHVQSEQVRFANPDPAYVETALTALREACVELGVPGAHVVFVDTVIPPRTADRAWPGRQGLSGHSPIVRPAYQRPPKGT